LGVPLINFSNTPRKIFSARKKIQVAFGIFALIGATTLGTTLAANISLNGGSNVEFGQGVAQTVACDDQITISPRANFDNSEEVSSHVFSSISLSAIDSTSDHCDGKDFIIKAYSNSGILDIFQSGGDSYSSVRVYDDGGDFFIVSDDLLDLEITSGENNSSDITNTSFTVNFSSPLASAEDVQRVTVESVDHVDTGLISYGGHLYQLVQNAVTWNAAYLDITDPVDGHCKYILNGRCGYFATITSNAERIAVLSNVGEGALWLGGSDIQDEGVWKWIDGPEYNVSISSLYENWSGGEPNNSGNEDALQTLPGAGGQWNDLSVNIQTLPYLIEYSSDFTARTNYLP
jgi:Lectin C-type domain